MVKVGFIVEGSAEKIILESVKFKKILEKCNIQTLGVFDAEGEGNFKVKSEKILQFFKIFHDRKADHIIIWTDKEDDPCITYTLDSIYVFDQKKQINLISVRALESWFLADSKALSRIFNTDFRYKSPENIHRKPFDEIKDLFIKFTGRGISKSRNRLAHKMVNNGFSVQEVAKHPQCKSAKYFLDKLESLQRKV